MNEFLDHFFVFSLDFKFGLKCSYFDGSLKYLLYKLSKLHVHLLHHKSLKISLQARIPQFTSLGRKELGFLNTYSTPMIRTHTKDKCFYIMIWVHEVNAKEITNEICQIVHVHILLILKMGSQRCLYEPYYYLFT